MGLILWQHEFYKVMEPRRGAYLYQTFEFTSKAKQKKEAWVRGVACAPTLRVRKFEKVEQRKGYLFHTAFHGCPEVVRVDNCTA